MEQRARRWFAAVGALVAALLLQAWLRPGRGAAEGAAAALDCGNHRVVPTEEDLATCGEDLRQLHQAALNLSGFMAATSSLFEERLVANETPPVLLCVGSCGHLCTARVAYLCWQRFLPRVVVIDPDPHVLAAVGGWLGSGSASHNALKIIHGGVCLEGASYGDAPCLSLEALLTEAQLALTDVDVLWVAGSEGSAYSARAVNALMAREGFRPVLVSSAGRADVAAGYRAVLEVSSHRSMVTDTIQEVAALGKSQWQVWRRRRLFKLQGVFQAWVDRIALGMLFVSLAAVGICRVVIWSSLWVPSGTPWLNEVTHLMVSSVLCATAFSVSATLVGLVLRCATRWHLHRELRKQERARANTQAFVSCSLIAGTIVALHLGRTLRRRGVKASLYLMLQVLKGLAVLALVAIVVNKSKPVVRKLRVPMAALAAELTRRPKELSCGPYSVLEPEPSEGCIEAFEGYLNHSRPEFEQYLAGLVREFLSRKRADPTPVFLHVGAGGSLCELAVSYPCVAHFHPRVVVVEPNPRLLPQLQRQLGELGLRWPQAVIVRAALKPTAETMRETQELFGQLAAGTPPEASGRVFLGAKRDLGFVEFFRGRQGSGHVFAHFDQQASVEQPDGSFLHRLPPHAHDSTTLFRAKVWGGVCGTGATVEFHVGIASVKYLRDGEPNNGWRPLFNLRVVQGSLQKPPNSLWTGSVELGGWVLAYLDAAQTDISVFATSCPTARLDFCMGNALPPKARDAWVSLSYRLEENRHRLPCIRRALVGGSLLKRIPDTAITASSVHRGCSLSRSRLDMHGPGAAWCPGLQDSKGKGMHIQWDLGSVQDISLLQMRGRADMHRPGEWVTKFRLQWSLDNSSWVEGGEEFLGNFDRNTIREVLFKHPFTARFVRLKPVEWHVWPSLRAELVSCNNTQEPLYAFSPRLSRDFDRLDSSFFEMASIDRNSLVSSHRLNFGTPSKNPGYTVAQWEAMAKTHIQELTARRLTPDELLKEAGITADSVDVLSVDARGVCLAVTLDFLGLDGLDPLALRFDPEAGEGATARALNAAVLPRVNSLLESRGYRLATLDSGAWAKKESTFLALHNASDREELAAPTPRKSLQVVATPLVALLVAICGARLVPVAFRKGWLALPSWWILPKLLWFVLFPGVFLHLLAGDVGGQFARDFRNLEFLFSGTQAATELTLSRGEAAPACAEVSYTGLPELRQFFSEVRAGGNWKWDFMRGGWGTEMVYHKGASLRSKPFVVIAGIQISVQSPAGNPGGAAVPDGRKATDVLAGMSTPGGFVGVALRSDESDVYLAHQRREGMLFLNYTREVLTFTSAQLAALVGQRVTLDIVDTGAGPGNTIYVSEVRFEGACAWKCRRFLDRSGLMEPSLNSIWQSLHGHFASKAAKGRAPRLLHVGAGSALCEMAEFHAYVSKWSPRYVLVEPNMELLPALRRRLREIRVRPSRAIVFNAALRPSPPAQAACSSPRPLLASLPEWQMASSGSVTGVQPVDSRLDGWGWVSSTLEQPWISWDLGRKNRVVLVATLGTNFTGLPCWTRGFRLQYSVDGFNWQAHHEDFPGNYDRRTLRQNVIRPAFEARFVKLFPLSWHVFPALRAELFACEDIEEEMPETQHGEWSQAQLHVMSGASEMHVPSTLNQFSALDSHVLHAGHQEAFTDRDINPGLDRASWDRLLWGIRKIKTSVLSPAALLADLAWHPRDVDVVTIDARGHNLDLVLEFLQLPEFSPVYLRFEWGVAANIRDPWNNTAAEEYLLSKLHPLTSALDDLGYQVIKVEHEIVAVRRALLNFQPLQLNQKPKRWAVSTCRGNFPRQPLSMEEIARVRCCNRQVGCFTPTLDVRAAVDFKTAGAVCAAMRSRLCSRHELEMGCHGECEPGLTWSNTIAPVLEDAAASHRPWRGMRAWVPARVVGVDFLEQKYLIEWYDHHPLHRVQGWESVTAIPTTMPRSLLFVASAVATYCWFLSTTVTWWGNSWLHSCLDMGASWCGISHSRRVVLLGLLTGTCLAGNQWSWPLFGLPWCAMVCPKQERRRVLSVAVRYMLLLRLAVFIAGGTWWSLYPPPIDVEEDANGRLIPYQRKRWPDQEQRACTAFLVNDLERIYEGVPENHTVPSSNSSLRLECQAEYGAFLGNDIFYSYSFLDELGAAFREKILVGERPNIVQVGPEGALCELNAFGFCLSRWLPRVHLVEPHPRARARLWQSLRLNASTDNPNVVLLEGALCPEDRAAASLYAFSPKLLEAFPLLQSDFLELSSMRRNVLVAAHWENFPYADKNPGYSEAEWENMTSYIEEVPSQCFSPDSLLQHLKLKREQVDVLTINARGYSVRLVEVFLEMQKFWPLYISFEWGAVANGHDDSNAASFRRTTERLIKHLELRGYQVGAYESRMFAVHSLVAVGEVAPDLLDLGRKLKGTV